MTFNRIGWAFLLLTLQGKFHEGRDTRWWWWAFGEWNGLLGSVLDVDASNEKELRFPRTYGKDWPGARRSFVSNEEIAVRLGECWGCDFFHSVFKYEFDKITSQESTHYPEDAAPYLLKGSFWYFSLLQWAHLFHLFEKPSMQSKIKNITLYNSTFKHGEQLGWNLIWFLFFIYFFPPERPVSG